MLLKNVLLMGMVNGFLYQLWIKHDSILKTRKVNSNMLIKAKVWFKLWLNVIWI